jgi:pantoate--beta-alanine ligase
VRTIEKVRAMQAWSREARERQHKRLALVPTMGALHAGHLSLVQIARRHADRVVASIFVNPTQFDRPDDLAAYPRDVERDRGLLAEAGVDVLFAPDATEMYPPGAQTVVDVADIATPLCGTFRPGHFRGVATVVLKLFNVVQPHVAVFGEKDFQQLALVRRMVRDLQLDIDVMGGAIIREDDGLAMSSRNQRLSAAERVAARCVPLALVVAAERLAAGESDPAVIAQAARAAIESEPLARVEYVEVVDPETLAPLATVNEEPQASGTGAAAGPDGGGTRRALLALAVWVGGTRLIDNRLLELAVAPERRKIA